MPVAAGPARRPAPASSGSHPSLRHQDHRPWPIPDRPWVGRQVWNDLAFLHWPVPAALLRPRVPPRLEIQQFGGSAWIAVTPFLMTGVAARGLPGVPGASAFPELNVRTYVALGDRPGVWFFSLDAGSRLAVWTARMLYHLPYCYAKMSCRRAERIVEYRSRRPTGEGFEGTYQATGPAVEPVPGTLEHFLTERYCLYAESRSGALYRAEIHHRPWPLQTGAIEIRRNDMLALHEFPIDGPPAHVHFAARLEVIVWLPVRLVDLEVNPLLVGAPA